jgi:hypothetical protein
MCVGVGDWKNIRLPKREKETSSVEIEMDQAQTVAFCYTGTHARTYKHTRNGAVQLTSKLPAIRCPVYSLIVCGII